LVVWLTVHGRVIGDSGTLGVHELSFSPHIFFGSVDGRHPSVSLSMHVGVNGGSRGSGRVHSSVVLFVPSPPVAQEEQPTVSLLQTSGAVVVADGFTLILTVATLLSA